MVVTASVYEQLFPFTTVAKQRMVEHFQGCSLCADRWTTVCCVASPTFQMVDVQDGGFEILTNARGERGVINFGGKNQYDCNGAVSIMVSRRVTATTQLLLGLIEGCGTFFTTCAHVFMSDDTTQTNKQLGTACTGACSNAVCTCTAINTSATGYKIDIKACCVDAYINGVVEATSSCNLPDTSLQPAISGRSRSTGCLSIRITYYEAYNT